MKRFLVAAIQIDTQNNKAGNLAKLEGFIDEAAARGARLIGMPEFVNYIGNREGELSNAETIPGPTIEFFAQKARQYGVWLHCGSIPEIIPGKRKVYNTSVLLNPAGEITALYRKIHLYDVQVVNGPSMLESYTKKPGEEIVVAGTELGKIGLSICYDLRFPELYRIMALRGAEIVFVPAMFALYTGKDHWEPLLRARAIENQYYIIAPGQIGVKPAFQTYGKSLIIDPWGEVIARSSDKEGIITAEIDLDYLYRVRSELPSLSNRRPAVYKWE
ncbi:MAG: carbon-nitrogen hydrolase family protein [Bacillota bacterium]|uniref:Carbon-nitrogen hydrolase family protein n=1 Tax=Thermanaerosceptrum fracticalcis TaxID=1712410 RepID=A0A7G6DYV0_THEFR|nr:carbon-nitrogen hydrolase family protein [Thermanaerosceptrum fracticalcis]QNB45004.1 carbon-nitrogen hydrolase family protein [Thermanaerosceptrum fracticalcis]